MNQNQQIGAIPYGSNSIGEQELYVIGSIFMITDMFPHTTEIGVRGVITTDITVLETTARNTTEKYPEYEVPYPSMGSRVLFHFLRYCVALKAIIVIGILGRPLPTMRLLKVGGLHTINSIMYSQLGAAGHLVAE